MRIIAGKHKGRRLVAPNKLPVRPTTDMAKEGLFNILQNRYTLHELSILDLFTGTGNISFEFASRGCKNIVAVDNHSACLAYINATSNLLDVKIKTVKSDVLAFLASTMDTFDLIFADPPYDISTDYVSKLHETVMHRNLMRSDGELIIEHAKKTDLTHLQGHSETRNYSNCSFSFFTR